MDCKHCENETVGVKEFIPLIVMFCLVIVWTVIFVFLRNTFSSVQAIMSAFMAGYFLLFGALKLFNIKGFANSYKNYDFIASAYPPFGYVYPFIEFILGLGYLFLFALPVVNIITLILMSLKAYSVRKALNEGKDVRCACLGGFFNIPITRITFFEDCLMVIMALTMLILMVRP